MKRICFFILSLFAAIPALQAQSNRSAVRIAFNDGSPVVVTLDDRRYKKHGTSLTIGDLPPGKHYLKVYAYTPFKASNGGNAELIFQGKVKIKANMFYNGIVDISNGTLTMNPEPLQGQANPPQNAPQPNSFNSGNDGQMADNNTNNNPAANAPATAMKDMPPYDFKVNDMGKLKLQIDKLETDSDKLKLMKSTLDKRTYITDEIRQMFSWLSFDDSRLDFVKWAYKGVVDPENYSSLGNEFSFGDTQKAFEQFLQGK